MAMQMIETGLLMSAQRWDMQRQGVKGGRVVLLAQNAGDDDNVIGLRRIVPSMHYDMFDQLRGRSVPGLFELLIRIHQGAQAHGAVVGLAVGATCYDMENEDDPNGPRIQGASVVFVQPYREGASADVMGFEVFDVRMDFPVFAQLKKLGLPGEYRFKTKLTSRTGPRRSPPRSRALY